MGFYYERTTVFIMSFPRGVFLLLLMHFPFQFLCVYFHFYFIFSFPFGHEFSMHDLDVLRVSFLFFCFFFLFSFVHRLFSSHVCLFDTARFPIFLLSPMIYHFYYFPTQFSPHLHLLVSFLVASWANKIHKLGDSLSPLTKTRTNSQAHMHYIAFLYSNIFFSSVFPVFSPIITCT